MGFLPKIIPSLPLLLAGDRWGLYQLVSTSPDINQLIISAHTNFNYNTPRNLWLNKPIYLPLAIKIITHMVFTC